MNQKNLRQNNGKNSKKKVYSFRLSVDNINKFNKKIGYGSRSKIVEILISNYLKKEKGEKIHHPPNSKLNLVKTGV